MNFREKLILLGKVTISWGIYLFLSLIFCVVLFSSCSQKTSDIKCRNFEDIKESINLVETSLGTYSPIVRLHDHNGEFFCTGIVISSNYVLTAAHCVVDENWDLETHDILIKNETENFSVIGKALTANVRADYALILGNFTDFKYMNIKADPNQIFFETSGPFASCGYPYGGKLFCSEVKILGLYNFRFITLTILFPGMSGGPVFSLTDGQIVGINSAVLNEKSLIAPTVEVFKNLGIEVE